MNPEELHEAYAAIGAAIWHLQFLEDVLVTYVTMRLRLEPEAPANQADRVLAAERRRTLGSLLTAATDGGLLVGDIADGFRLLLDERNWLVHRSMLEVSDRLYSPDVREPFLVRVRTLADRAIELKKALFADASAWCATQGVDLKRVDELAFERFRK